MRRRSSALRSSDFVLPGIQRKRTQWRPKSGLLHFPTTRCTSTPRHDTATSSTATWLTRDPSVAGTGSGTRTPSSRRAESQHNWERITFRERSPAPVRSAGSERSSSSLTGSTLYIRRTNSPREGDETRKRSRNPPSRRNRSRASRIPYRRSTAVSASSHALLLRASRRSLLTGSSQRKRFEYPTISLHNDRPLPTPIQCDTPFSHRLHLL